MDFNRLYEIRQTVQTRAKEMLKALGVEKELEVIIDFSGVPSMPDPYEIRKVVSNELGVSTQLIQSKVKFKEVVKARMYTSYFICRYHPQLSLKKVGKYVGVRHHSSVLNHIEKIEVGLKYYASDRKEYRLLKNKIHEFAYKQSMSGNKRTVSNGRKNRRLETRVESTYSIIKKQSPGKYSI